MLRLDWQLTLLSLAIVPLLIGTIYFFAKRIRSQSTTIQEQESALLTQTQEGLSSIRMVHAFGREEFEVSQFHQQAHGSLQANLRLTMTNVKSALVISTLIVIGTAAMYYVGSLHVLAGTLSLGVASRFHRLSSDALSAARIAHLHSVGNGRRNSGGAALFRNSRSRRTTSSIPRTPSRSKRQTARFRFRT